MPIPPFEDRAEPRFALPQAASALAGGDVLDLPHVAVSPPPRSSQGMSPSERSPSLRGSDAAIGKGIKFPSGAPASFASSTLTAECEGIDRRVATSWSGCSRGGATAGLARRIGS